MAGRKKPKLGLLFVLGLIIYGGVFANRSPKNETRSSNSLTTPYRTLVSKTTSPSTFEPVISFAPVEIPTIGVSQIIPVRPQLAPTQIPIPTQLLSATFELGSNTPETLEVKKKMQTLGYFRPGAELTNKYNATTAERVKLFQKNNGLEQTGIVDLAFLTALYSDNPAMTGEYGLDISKAAKNPTVKSNVKPMFKSTLKPTAITTAQPAAVSIKPKSMLVKASASTSGYNSVGNE